MSSHPDGRQAFGGDSLSRSLGHLWMDWVPIFQGPSCRFLHLSAVPVAQSSRFQPVACAAALQPCTSCQWLIRCMQLGGEDGIVRSHGDALNHHPCSIRIFHEINHPAIKGYPHDYGNPPNIMLHVDASL